MLQKQDILGCFEAIKLITSGISYYRLYFEGHPRVTEAIDGAFQAISAMTASGHTITLACVNNAIIINDTHVRDQSPVLQKFFQILENKAIDGITFLSGVTRREVLDMIQAMASDSLTLPVLRHITFGRLASESPGRLANESPGSMPEEPDENLLVLDLSRDSGLEEEKVSEETQLFQSVEFDRLKQIFEDIKTKPNHSVVDELTACVELFMKGFSRSLQPMQYLNSIKSFDEYTFVHSVNVFILTTSQAEFLGFKGQQLYDIGVASVLHDVGKLFISDDILNKPGRLDKDEMRIMQTHSLKGARYLMGINGISRLAPICALNHHIHYDGSGYPGVRNRKPDIISQMISIADTFDAMRSRRPYQEPRSQKIVIETLLRESGQCFNPILVDNFLKLLGLTLASPNEESVEE